MGGDDLENWKIRAKKGCQKRFRQQAWCKGFSPQEIRRLKKHKTP
jgi:hypothetical protein